MYHTDIMFRALVAVFLLSSEVHGLLLQNVPESDNVVLQAQVKAMNVTIQSLSERLSQLENKISAPPVAFLAELGHEIVNPAVGSGVVFDVVHLNDGNAYSNVHGIFTAPVAGVYHFTLELSSPQSTSSHMLHVHIMKSNIPLGYIYLDGNTDRWIKRSATATVHLSTGDDVWAKVTLMTKDNITIAGTGFHSIFSGFLIKAN